MSDNQFLSGKTPAGDALVLTSLQGQEEVSIPFLFTLQFSSADHKIDFKKLVGKNASVQLVLPDRKKRTLHGVITRFLQSGYDPRESVYIAELRPWLWLLTLHADNRIFQNKTVPEILEEVFSDLSFKDFKNSLKGTYAKREYCVQYQESTFDFVSRLMEDEGIFYFFEHTEDKHTLVLADDSDTYAACQGSSEARMGVDPDKNCVRDCSFEQSMSSTGYALTDFNFEIPSTDLYAKSGGGSAPKLVVYEHPGNYAKKDEGQNIAKRRIESRENAQKVLRGASNCRGFTAGGKFKLKEHGRADLNKEYVLRMVSHVADRSNYGNHFEALPADVVLRPIQRTRRPMALGSQTALVVGKSGEEIWTDKYGRVKVQFVWDRKGKKDENSSCWVRVAQHWAGKSYGQFFLPRIGQEVVVSFIDGNPDRPLITGSVYNAEQTVPYGLPDNQTKSTIKTHSSKEGDGFNELRFEDKKDSEEIYIHAQKDMKTEVKNDRTLKVENDDKSVIKKNREVEISEGDEKLTVKKGARTILVDKGDEKHEVKGKRTLTVHKDEARTDKAKFDHDVEKDYTLNVKGNLTINVDGKVTIKAKKSILYEAQTTFDVKSGKDMTIKSGAKLQQEAQMNLEQKAGIGLKQEGVTIETKASAKADVDGGGMLNIKGGMVKIN